MRVKVPPLSCAEGMVGVGGENLLLLCSPGAGACAQHRGENLSTSLPILLPLKLLLPLPLPKINAHKNGGMAEEGRQGGKGGRWWGRGGRGQVRGSQLPAKARHAAHMLLFEPKGRGRGKVRAFFVCFPFSLSVQEVGRHIHIHIIDPN